jgi:hypothetical protein
VAGWGSIPHFLEHWQRKSKGVGCALRLAENESLNSGSSDIGRSIYNGG